MAAWRRLLLALVAVALGMLIGSMVWGASERNPAEAHAAGSATSSQRAVQPKWNIPIVSQFAQSFASWDYKKVRALFTPDGVLANSGSVYAAYHNKNFDPSPNRVDGAVFQHLIQEHLGEPMKVVGTPIRVGNTVVFGWAFSGVSGTGLFELRGGKIVTAIIYPGQVG